MLYNRNYAEQKDLEEGEELINATTGSAEYELLEPRRGSLKFEINGTPGANIKVTVTANPGSVLFNFSCTSWNNATVKLYQKPDINDVKEGTIDYSETADVIGENCSRLLKF